MYIHDGNKNILKALEAQIVQTLKNNEPRSKFTGSYQKKACRGPKCEPFKT